MGTTGYEIPRYRVADEVPWYHVLHGNVPEHQIDFMYCPEVPQGLLTATHFSHLARLMKCIEPQTGATHAFAIGNLSRDDTQHEAGHGAIGLIFGFRIGGATDHAGRGSPPFAHGIVAVDRDLRYATLLEAAATFYRHVMNAGEADSSAGNFYRAYVRAVLESQERVTQVLEHYVEEFEDLPQIGRSELPWEWAADEGAQPKRVVIVHGDDEPFGVIAHAASRIAAVLLRSNIKWTSITSGREADISGGVSVRFVSERDLGAEDRQGLVMRIEDVGEGEAQIARTVFGARAYGAEAERPKLVDWRERFAARPAAEVEAEAERPEGARTAGAVPVPGLGPEGTLIIPPEELSEARGGPEGRGSAAESEDEAIEVVLAEPIRSRAWIWVVGLGACAAIAAMALVTVSEPVRENGREHAATSAAGVAESEQTATEAAPAATRELPEEPSVAAGTASPAQSAMPEQGPQGEHQRQLTPERGPPGSPKTPRIFDAPPIFNKRRR